MKLKGAAPKARFAWLQSRPSLPHHLSYPPRVDLQTATAEGLLGTEGVLPAVLKSTAWHCRQV